MSVPQWFVFFERVNILFRLAETVKVSGMWIGFHRRFIGIMEIWGCADCRKQYMGLLGGNSSEIGADRQIMRMCDDNQDD